MHSSRRTGSAIKRAEQALMASKGTALRPLGLTVAQYTALLLLSELPGVSGAELARRAGVTAQTMSTLLGTLEAKDLVVRSAHPRHTSVVEVSLTPVGADLLAEADARALAVERDLDEALGGRAGELRDLLATAVDALAVAQSRTSGDRAGSRPGS